MTARDLLPILAFAAAVALAPLLVTSNVVLNFLVFTMIIALAAQGWNLLGGYGGQYSFGHAAFFGTGAYLTAILQVRYGMNAYPAFAAGIALAALVGLAIGFLAFRSGLRGSYFALVTLAFAEVFRVLANASEVTGGAAGILIRLRADPANFQFAERGTFLWVALALVTLALIATLMLERSRLGAQLVAVRENEAAAQALGVDVLAVKLRAIALSAGMTGAAGGLYAQYFLYLDANIAYGTWISVEALLAPIVGGAGTVFGPVLGAVILHGLSEATKSVAGSVPGIDLVVFGIVLILVVRYPPRDIPGLLRRRRRP
jgi:branched-chain amino acid transport system permease protein